MGMWGIQALLAPVGVGEIRIRQCFVVILFLVAADVRGEIKRKGNAGWVTTSFADVARAQISYKMDLEKGNVSVARVATVASIVLQLRNKKEKGNEELIFFDFSLFVRGM